MRRSVPVMLIGMLVLGLAACGAQQRRGVRGIGPRPGELHEIARSDGYQWTGVAVSSRGRVFVCYPRWEGPIRNSVEEIMPDGRRVAFPDEAWNSWEPGAPAGEAFVCVQSVHIDDRDRMWVLDPASPRMAGVVPGGAKLVEISLRTGKVLRVIRFGERVAPQGSYLNDVRVDTARDVAYITDSGLGAIVVVDLATNTAWRRLEKHASTKGEPGTVLRVGGRPLLRGGSGGEPPVVHADGLALDAANGWLYYQALTSRTLYRVPTEVLADPLLSEEAVEAAVERVGVSVATDGMEIDDEGNIYFTALEHDALMYRTPEGRIRTLVRDERLRWPDSLAIAPGGWIVVTTSQIHLTPLFRDDGQMPETPYYVLRVGMAGPEWRWEEPAPPRPARPEASESFME